MSDPEHPAPRDPRARRWTILLVLLAIVVVAGVVLRVVDDRRASSDRASDRTQEEGDERKDGSGQETVATTEGEDEPADETDAGAESTTDGTVPVDEPLGIVVGQVPAVTGAPADVVYGLGPVSLGNPSTLPDVTALFGDPDSSGADPGDANVCAAAWAAHGFEARFYFGHPPSLEASCTQGPVAAALMTGERWFIQADGKVAMRALEVGDPVTDIRAAVPDAREEPLSPGLATLAGSPNAWLLGEGSYGGDPYPTLYAVVVDGSIASFLYVSGAD